MTTPIPDPYRPHTYLIGSATDPYTGAQTGSAVVVAVHHPDHCHPHQCTIHNPSTHHMREWPLNWRSDTRVMERICPHNTGHPDPDDAAHATRTGQAWRTVHGCDGCCTPPRKDPA